MIELTTQDRRRLFIEALKAELFETTSQQPWPEAPLAPDEISTDGFRDEIEKQELDSLFETLFLPPDSDDTEVCVMTPEEVASEIPQEELEQAYREMSPLSDCDDGSN